VAAERAVSVKREIRGDGLIAAGVIRVNVVDSKYYMVLHY
jgi:hypothetical protein